MLIQWNSLAPTAQMDALARPAMADSAALTATVKDIIDDVATRGDEAVLSMTAKFDGVELASLALSKTLIEAGIATLDDTIKTSINVAFANITAFHEAQRPQDVQLTTQPGVDCELKHVPIEAVGLYIPGGTAPLPSTVLMLGATAQVAGCPRKVLCSPPNAHGSLAPEILYAASLCGINEIYLCGGAQAIAALALGTDTIGKVNKIFGPGNSFVTEAKQQVSLLPAGPAIDMPAGPSEVLVLADQFADADFVASDLLSQAEHGKDSQAILVTESLAFAQAVQVAVTEQLATLSRCDIATHAMQHARYIVTESIEQAIEVSNEYAPEHLIVQVRDTDAALASLTNAGSIFVGAWSPESAGDYASGTNHVLPTYGYSRHYSSLGLLDFMRRYTVQTLSKEGLAELGPHIMNLANAEGLDAHRQAVAIRLAKLNQHETL
ncbi:histidinol dehydrogenase [Glaciecola sp. HTCC2999]|uniref:histidinol dehydrogenase n=1 Tax=Glaciecola sp. HTCC2999 TaxID=455436 RepID=UPI0000E0E6BC|nr:histidinol dehydrogenase [Glaciecola sp. HTCC2999]